MNNLIEEALVPIVAIVCIFGLPVLVIGFVIVKAMTSDTKERLALAKQGIIAPKDSKPAPNKYRSLRNGILCVGIAIGLIVSMIIVSSLSFDDYMEFLIILSSTILSLGIAYIVFYLIVKDKNLDE